MPSLTIFRIDPCSTTAKTTTTAEASIVAPVLPNAASVLEGLVEVPVPVHDDGAGVDGPLDAQVRQLTVVQRQTPGARRQSTNSIVVYIWIKMQRDKPVPINKFSNRRFKDSGL